MKRFDTAKLQSFRRTVLMLALILALGVSVSGCMGRDENKAAEGGVNQGRITQPSPSPDYMPQGGAAGAGASGNDAVKPAAPSAPVDWSKRAAELEQRIARLSEISEARIVVEGDTALVGVKFNPAYQGEMTERIREMVAAELMQADPQIKTVAVTADDEDVQGVYELSDRLLAGTPLEQLKDRISEIVRNATTLR